MILGIVFGAVFVVAISIYTVKVFNDDKKEKEVKKVERENKRI